MSLITNRSPSKRSPQDLPYRPRAALAHCPAAMARMAAVPLISMERFLRRYWGLAVLALLLFAWTREVGPGALLLLSALVTFWAAFQAPAWCGAANRPGGSGAFCRNNSHGLLLGCHLREHRWQKFQMIFYSRRWRELTRGMWMTPTARLATVSGLAGIVSLGASLVAAI
jgi:hypothetical protein